MMFFELAPFLGISAGGIIRCPRSPNTPVNFDFFAFVVFTKMYNLQFVLFSTHTHSHNSIIFFPTMLLFLLQNISDFHLQRDDKYRQIIRLSSYFATPSVRRNNFPRRFFNISKNIMFIFIYYF